MNNVTFRSEEYVEVDDSLLPCAVQETDNLCTEDKNTETDDKNEDMDTELCKPIPQCSEVMQCLDIYCHFLRGIPEVPESIIRNLLEMEHFASYLIEIHVK
jgi:hypothetical protein